MQDWFYVQSATYGSYYISVEINGYDVYKVALSYYNPDTNMVDYPTDETTTGNKAYARRRYKQLMKRAEENFYGWNCGIENPTWEFNQSDWKSTQKYIFSSSMPSKSNYQFKWIDDTYLGGNMIGVYGQLANGDYFYTNDSIDGVWFLNANPAEMLEYWTDDYWYDWLKEHEVGGLDGKEFYKFWIDLFKYCKKTGFELSTYEDLDYAIKEFAKYI